MLAKFGPRVNLSSVYKPAIFYLERPYRLFRSYQRSHIRPDLIAGITVAVILLPQGIAFAFIAELPPQMGVYTAIVGAIFAALWGSSDQMQTGPTNSISLLVFSSLSGIIAVGSPEYVIAAGMVALMAGLFQLAMGLARLGILVNFVSHSVIVGFASGASILIAIRQFQPLLGMNIPSDTIVGTLTSTITNLNQVHWPTAVLGIGVMVFIVILRRINPKLPSALISMILASVIVYVLRLDKAGVSVIGQLPHNLPPLAKLPIFDLTLISKLSPGALAIGAIGLVQTSAIARSLAARTGQRPDSNQEFVGQGMANIASGLFSGYPVTGSFPRTAINYEAGAKSAFSSIFAALFVIIAMFALGPMAAYLPRTALAGVVIVIAYGMVDTVEIRRIWQGAAGDAAIMVITLMGTLVISLEFAVLIGILVSLALYVLRTSTPRVLAVIPDPTFKHFNHQPAREGCPQLIIIEILGDLYFGAVNHVEEIILEHLKQSPDQRFLMLRMHSVAHVDFSGIHMLESIVHTYRERGGDVFMVRVGPPVMSIMESTGFDLYLGKENFLEDDTAISHLFYRKLDPAICIYECPWRVFKECQNLPKRSDLIGISKIGEVPIDSAPTITPMQLWQELHGPEKENLHILDVREPREYNRGHIPQARLLSLADILSNPDTAVPPNAKIILVCRRGRRSRRAAHTLQERGMTNLAVMEGGMIAWEAAGLLEAVEL
ncbi:MAG: sulfate permease [Chloroflexi bacterium]|nr:sulfate permease [Chloroflexota bacterium]MBP7041276.1 sulfate permease [Chloroflexota bacterium]